MERLVFESSGKSYADPGSLLTGLQSETQYVQSKNKKKKRHFIFVRQHYSVWTRDSVDGTAIGLQHEGSGVRIPTG